MWQHQDESIHDAARRGDIARVCKILTRDSSCVNDYNDDLKTPLSEFIKNFTYDNTEQLENGLKLLQLLIDYGADVNLCTRSYVETNQISPLEMACRKNQVAVVEHLLQNKADPNMLSTFALSEIMLDLNVSKDIVKLLIDFKMNLNNFCGSDEDASCFLEIAIAKKDLDIVQQFVESGAKCPNIYETLVSVCNHQTKSSQVDRKITKYLLAHALELDTHGQFSPEALMYYVLLVRHDKSHYEIEQQCPLLEWLFEKNIKSNNGDSYLHQAVRDLNVVAVRTLLQMKMDVNRKNHFGDTPLHVLLETFARQKSSTLNKCLDIYKLLIAHGADVRSYNHIDATPFQIASDYVAWNFMNLILAKITNLDVKTLQKETFLCKRFLPVLNCCKKDDLKMHELIYAINFGYTEVVDRLLDVDNYSDQSTISCKNFDFALAVAVQTRHYTIVKMLLEAGFNSDSANYLDINLEDEYFHDLYYERRQYNDDYMLRIGCLLWEFKDSSGINGVIIKVTRLITRLTSTMYIPMNSEYLFIFLYAINIRINKLDKELVPMKGLFKLHQKQVLPTILTECNKKLDELKKIKVGEVIISNIMTMQLDSLVKLLNNTTYFDACTVLFSVLQEKKKLVYYEYSLKTRLELAIEKKKVLNSAKKNLDNVLQKVILSMHLNSLPDEIIYNILSYLNMRQLKKLAKVD